VAAPRTAELTRALAGLTGPCPVRDCKRERQPLKLMCGPHWHQVPAPLQRAVYAAWRDGERAGTPAHRAACAAATGFVERLAQRAQDALPRSAVVMSRGKYEDRVRDVRGHLFLRAKGDESQGCLHCQTAARLSAAGIGPDDPALEHWAGWNAIAFAAARCPAVQGPQVVSR